MDKSLNELRVSINSILESNLNTCEKRFKIKSLENDYIELFMNNAHFTQVDLNIFKFIRFYICTGSEKIEFKAYKNLVEFALNIMKVLLYKNSFLEDIFEFKMYLTFYVNTLKRSKSLPENNYINEIYSEIICRKEVYDSKKS